MYAVPIMPKLFMSTMSIFGLFTMSTSIVLMPKLSALSASTIINLFWLSTLSISVVLMPELFVLSPIHISLYAYFCAFSYWCLYLFFYYKSQPRASLNIDLINLYNIIFITSLILPTFSGISKIIASRAFTEYKNLMLKTSSHIIDSHIITNSAIII